MQANEAGSFVYAGLQRRRGGNFASFVANHCSNCFGILFVRSFRGDCEFRCIMGKIDLVLISGNQANSIHIEKYAHALRK